MPPRRRKANSDDSTTNDSSTSASKRVKRDTSGSLAKWQWEDDGGRWKAFADAHNEVLTDAFTNGQTSAVISVNKKVNFDVNLAGMYQRNKTTSWRRNIRCVEADGTCSDDWEWEDEGGSWVSYSVDVARRLEAGRICGLKSVEFSVGGREYKLEIEEMKQVNVETKMERNVRRNDAGSFTGWEWENENGEWTSYLSSICCKLETSYSTNPTSDVNITAVGRLYTVHLSSMEQENDETAVVRKVRRKGGVAAGQAAGGSTKRTKSAAKKKKVKEDEDEEDETEDVADTVKSVVFQGRAPVDSLCTSKQSKAHVYYDAVDVWDTMLNQTNLKNNNNKFYIIQLLEENSKRSYSVWMRWGRVGFSGQNSLVECGSDIDRAKQVFEKKFFDKTKNQWSDRASFVKCPGKYDLLKIDYTTQDDEDEDKVDGPEDTSSQIDTKPTKPTSHLDIRLQQLIELICNVKAMEETVVEMKYDTKKAPLGKLTKDQIKAGYAALKRIESCIRTNDYGDGLVRACDDFYTRIPHAFGMTRPPTIRTTEQVKAKMSLLEALGDIEIAMRVMSEKGHADEHPIDRQYTSLKCQMTPLDKEVAEYKIVERYVKTTHAKTHNQYTLDVLDVFSIHKKSMFTDIGNRQLLWHGSRLTNWVGILSEGLKIAPPEAPVTGYMFGKGVYFADICSKSANYCFATRSKNVSLGTTNDLLAADYDADQLPRGKQSVMGKGRIAPDPGNIHTMSDGCVVPLGPTCDTKVHNPHGYTLNYNEYVIYDVKQIKMRYLVKLRFNFQ
ncbi:poly [ADP-ribose] polymerase 2-like isoform X2 [Corticium candelabrum]|uniref:poly [ADP-ribose] polymerase 2-like isoform X2 n=1 Tax=Corticium candelabrum TaxID=121492 RepID=UPI002E2741A9|nr:poly [ADP-ribose] polymerase 2-like isoform X2 [Corticium candelabrum]